MTSQRKIRLKLYLQAFFFSNFFMKIKRHFNLFLNLVKIVFLNTNSTII